MADLPPTTMLYRPAATKNPAVWNIEAETQIVLDEDIDAALAEGWYRHPDDFPAAEAKPKPGKLAA